MAFAAFRIWSPHLRGKTFSCSHHVCEFVALESVTSTLSLRGLFSLRVFSPAGPGTLCSTCQSKRDREEPENQPKRRRREHNPEVRPCYTPVLVSGKKNRHDVNLKAANVSQETLSGQISAILVGWCSKSLLGNFKNHVLTKRPD